MSHHEVNPMAGHEVDGISELDNLLPRWWLWLFWLCNIFAVGYMVYYHVAKTGPLQEQAYALEMQSAQQARDAADAARAATAPQVDTTRPSPDSAILAKGKALFGANCVACHAAEGQGLIGPNLCDNFWIHGGEFANILNTINEGVPAKGMISWKLTMKPDDIYAVASYIWTLNGKDVSKAVPPPKPVEPEAKEYIRSS
jgi:cytochrome c oxidase cbb3-type subunit 3